MTRAHLLGVAELAARLGVSQTAVSQRLRRGALPPPDARLAMGPVWTEATIAAWERARSA